VPSDSDSGKKVYGVQYQIGLRVVDSFGLSSGATMAHSIVRVFSKYPQAVISVPFPNPAGCRSDIVFFGGTSTHFNPRRYIARYEWTWDVDGTTGLSTSVITTGKVRDVNDPNHYIEQDGTTSIQTRDIINDPLTHPGQTPDAL